jgi:hypothetical protein
MAGARDFTELTCLQLAEDLKLETYRLCRRPAIHRDREFRDQWLDAAASAPRNIAEGFGRHTHREFARYLSIARASLFECRQHIRDGGGGGGGRALHPQVKSEAPRELNARRVMLRVGDPGAPRTSHLAPRTSPSHLAPARSAPAKRFNGSVRREAR